MKKIEEVVYLSPKDMPKAWYNVLPDLPEPLPPWKDPETGPSRIEALKRIYVNQCLKYDENYKDRWVPIPDSVIQAYIHAGRPTPLYRAWRMEKFLNTPAHIYYKREDTSPTGSYKIISNLPQVEWARQESYDRVFTCSSGTQGSGLCYAAAQLGLKAVVFIYASAYDARPGRVFHFKQMGAEVVRTPSDTTEIGREMRKEDPNQPGSWLTSAMEMLEVLNQEKVRRSAYVMGSVNTHNILFLTIMGLELKKQLELAGEDGPDVIVDCAGAGGTWSGICLPFVKDRIDGKTKTRFVACQNEHFACFSDGKYEYVDAFIINPLMKVYSLGWRKDVPQCQAKGIQIPNGAIIPSYLRHKGIMEARKFSEKDIAKAALQWVRIEGYIPAMESTYAIKGGIDEAIKAKEEGKKKVIVINISGHGYYDHEGYRAYLKMIGE